MPSLYVRCGGCEHGFSSGYTLGVGSVGTFYNNWTHCPRCGAPVAVPDGTFRGAAGGVYAIVMDAADSAATAEELLGAVQRGRAGDSSALDQSPSFRALEARLEKLGPISRSVVLGIVEAAVVALIGMHCSPPSEQVFIDQSVKNYNSIIIEACDASAAPAAPVRRPVPAVTSERAGEQPLPAAAPPRNRPCPCGSGKNYKHCHGKAHPPISSRDPIE